MRYLISLGFALITINSFSQKIDFNTYFEDKSLRVDYLIAGDINKTEIFFYMMKEEPYWGGSLVNLIDKFQYGDFMLDISDLKTGNLIYSRGFSSLYYEWLDLDEAKKIKRSFYDAVVFPFPKNEITLTIKMRNNDGVFVEIGKRNIKPDDYKIMKENTNVETEKIYNTGDHHKKLDIVIIAEGYTKHEMGKFKKDCNRFKDYFFKVAPFSEHKDKVNIWAVKAISEESGTDVPGKNIWKKTALNTKFYTFDMERYLTTEDINTLRNYAGTVPYDQIYILVNTSIYGGGGIYNYYNLCVSDHSSSEEVFTHEFGHSFAALADEYEYGFDKAEDIYNMKVEPWQVNITNLVDFDKKWKDLLDKDTPIPTPDEEKYKDKIGAFEGAGYVKKKMYRSTHDCKMRSNSTNEFCPVCYKAVLELLLFYSE